ncbi:MAG TPA: hypothetical protein VMT64_14845, partial [Candidatus Binataceae bacterium]|nr:hypothetical protein [Candidatus Binataceae bacterium]
EGLNAHVIRLGKTLIGLTIGCRLKMSMGGIECGAESFGNWVVHPDYRGQNLWGRVGTVPGSDAALLIAWSVAWSRSTLLRSKWVTTPYNPLIRILDSGPVVEHFTHSKLLGSLGAGAGAMARAVAAPLRRRRNPGGAVVRLEAFDERADALWERARPIDKAIVVRDREYLNWRYCARPDATYSIFGVEGAAGLDGFTVARVADNLGMRWGYLVDFLAAEPSGEVFSSLIDAAVEDFRRRGVAVVSCYTTDAKIRRNLMRHGFFPSPQRHDNRFGFHLKGRRTDLQPFTDIKRWYVTIGDSDMEMGF